jgi:hypothetical protein
MDALKQFLESIKSNHRELILIFFGFVGVGYSIFLFYDIVFSFLKFEFKLLVKKYIKMRLKL